MPQGVSVGAWTQLRQRGQDARRRRLAAAARAGEEVGVGDAVGPQRRHERSGDVVLPDDLLEGVGAVAAVQNGGCVNVYINKRKSSENECSEFR